MLDVVVLFEILIELFNIFIWAFMCFYPVYFCMCTCICGWVYLDNRNSNMLCLQYRYLIISKLTEVRYRIQDVHKLKHNLKSIRNIAQIWGFKFCKVNSFSVEVFCYYKYCLALKVTPGNNTGSSACMLSAVSGSRSWGHCLPMDTFARPLAGSALHWLLILICLIPDSSFYYGK